MDCPVRHGEGKYVMPDSDSLENLSNNNQIVVRYVDPKTKPGEGLTDEILPFPISPNGSMKNIAGISDKTGLIFGLMPHPEAVYAKWLSRQLGGTQHREQLVITVLNGKVKVLQIFRNAIEYVKNNR